MFSILDMFKVGVGPSSSHTVGPMAAGSAFASSLEGAGLLPSIHRVQVTLYGSLSLTGLGHGTDRAAMAGLEGNMPATVDTDHLLRIRQECEASHALDLAGRRPVDFDYDRDVVFEKWKRLAPHTNGMRFRAFAENGDVLSEQVWYSIGGGFIRQGNIDDQLIGIHDNPPQASSGSEREGGDESEFSPEAPYRFRTCDELLELCRKHDKSISQIAWENETAVQPAAEVRARLLNVWRYMQDCVRAGCTSPHETLPGGLNVPRRAPKIYRRLASGADMLNGKHASPRSILYDSHSAWIDLFAMAVNEENAGGGRIITAPTNGSAGIIPAVLEYYWHFVDSSDEDGIVCFLLTAGAIGYLFKRNASISGAEVGCQGEVGSACSMAAAGLCAVMGGTPEQVENAAEIGIEHHLGLTCDPVGGLVQVPCIERNAVAANTALNAVRVALLGDGGHIVSLDQAIKTMRDTGADMMSEYKETSKGGLAVNVVEC